MDLRTNPTIREDLEQEGVTSSPVDDVNLLDSAIYGVKRAADLWNHAAYDGTVGNQTFDVSRAQ